MFSIRTSRGGTDVIIGGIDSLLDEGSKCVIVEKA